MSRVYSDSVLKLFLKISTVVLIFFLAACNRYYTDQNIQIKDGLIYKVGQSEPFTGRVLDTLYNNILEYDVVAGLKNGTFRVSSLEGVVSVYGNIHDNMNTGLWNYYYPNGQLESEGYFKDDQPHGKWTWYYPNGNVKETGTYFESSKSGTWYKYKWDGILESKSVYDSGEKINEIKYNLSKNV